MVTAPTAFPPRLVLTLNGGSSSLKWAVFEAADLALRARGVVERIGQPTAGEVRDHAAAVEIVLDGLRRQGLFGEIVAVGHRVVHGGALYDRPQRITHAVLGELRRLSSLDPDHLPAEIAIAEAVSAQAPALPQVACFDTAFHRAMPRVARLLPIPREYEARGVERYGFHGLSYTFLMEELARVAGPSAADGRVILAHLGAGASLAAIRAGRCVDTTMGFTPTSGIMMATRSGDLDPGVLFHLARAERMTVGELDELCNQRSGLLGVSGSSSDMRDLLAREGADERAADAVALFCHQVRKAIGALAAVLGGVDTLVFAGGIGEHAAPIRTRVSDGLEHLGLRLDATLNASGAPVVSVPDAACTVRVMRTDEESILARETMRLIHGDEDKS